MLQLNTCQRTITQGQENQGKIIAIQGTTQQRGVELATQQHKHQLYADNI